MTGGSLEWHLAGLLTTWVVATAIWFLMALVLTELIDLSQCSQLQEAVRSFESRRLSQEEQATKDKLEEWLVRAKCHDKKRDV